LTIFVWQSQTYRTPTTLPTTTSFCAPYSGQSGRPNRFTQAILPEPIRLACGLDQLSYQQSAITFWSYASSSATSSSNYGSSTSACRRRHAAIADPTHCASQRIASTQSRPRPPRRRPHTCPGQDGPYRADRQVQRNVWRDEEEGESRRPGRSGAARASGCCCFPARGRCCGDAGGGHSARGRVAQEEEGQCGRGLGEWEEEEARWVGGWLSACAGRRCYAPCRLRQCVTGKTATGMDRTWGTICCISVGTLEMRPCNCILILVVLLLIVCCLHHLFVYGLHFHSALSVRNLCLTARSA
jgi:hypothetical protein